MEHRANVINRMVNGSMRADDALADIAAADDVLSEDREVRH